MHVFRRTMPNGELSPTYYVRVRVQGRQILRSTGHTKKKEAERWARTYVDDLRSQQSAKGVAEAVWRIAIGGRGVRVEDAWELFKRAPSRKPIAERRREQQESVWDDFRAYLKATWPNVTQLNEVDSRVARGYMAHLRTEGRWDRRVRYRRGRTWVEYENPATALSARTANVYQQTLQQLFDALRDEAGILENPWTRLPITIHRPARRQAYTVEELAEIARHLDWFTRPLVILGLYTGLRKGDICTLQWDDVDIEDRWIARTTRKTDANAGIPMLEPVRRLLESRRRTRSPYVLPHHAAMYQRNPAGIDRRMRQLFERVNKARKKKKLPLLETSVAIEGRSRRASVRGLHSFRHTLVTLAALQGIPMPVVQSIVGHLTADMTRMYADHATREAKRALKLPDLFGGERVGGKTEDTEDGPASADLV